MSDPIPSVHPKHKTGRMASRHGMLPGDAEKGKRPIDYKLVEDLTSIGCTLDEIAGIFGCHKSTLQHYTEDPDFKECLERGRGNMRKSIRRKQFEMLNEIEDVKDKKGEVIGQRTSKNAGLMAIWLGKQYLGQRDKHENTGTDGSPQGIKVEVRSVLMSGTLAAQPTITVAPLPALPPPPEAEP